MPADEFVASLVDLASKFHAAPGCLSNRIKFSYCGVPGVCELTSQGAIVVFCDKWVSLSAGTDAVLELFQGVDVRVYEPAIAPATPAALCEDAPVR